MHHIKMFCHLLNRRNKTILVTPIPTEKALFFPPLVKRCFFSQDLSIIAAYSQCHIFQNEKFDLYSFFYYMRHLTIWESFPHYTGALCTIGALSYGLFSFVRGDQKMQQYMMRARVAAQGGTLMAVVAGVFYMLYQERQAKGGKT